MNKKEYLDKLNGCLASLPIDEREAAIKYYDEFFEDAGKEAEQDVINDLGPAEKLAESIIGEQNFAGKSSSDYVPVKAVTVSETKKKMSAGMIVLIVILAIFASPILLGVGAGILGVLVGMLAAVIGVFAGVFAAVVALVFAGSAGIFISIAGIFINPPAAMLSLTISLLSLAVGLFLAIPCFYLCVKGIPAVCRLIARFFNWIFRRNKKSN